jgi:hypothetical protein
MRGYLFCAKSVGINRSSTACICSRVSRIVVHTLGNGKARSQLNSKARLNREAISTSAIFLFQQKCKRMPNFIRYCAVGPLLYNFSNMAILAVLIRPGDSASLSYAFRKGVFRNTITANFLLARATSHVVIWSGKPACQFP